MTDPNDPERTDGAELLARYREEIRFESELLSSRLNAFLSSQAFLVIAYASALSAAHGRWQHPFTLALPPALAVLGLVLALYARPGIRAAVAVITQWHEQERELLRRRPELASYLGPATPANSGRATSDDDGSPGDDRDDDAPSMDARFRQGTVFALRTPWIFVAAWSYFAVLPLLLYHS